jgi:uncharacterized OB-fold protein
MEQRKKVIPESYIPVEASRTLRLEGKDYLLMNDAMYTFYERSMGEFSQFFMALRDEKKILGCRCSACGIVRCPPMLTHCPDCAFAPTETIEVGQTGNLLSTPPITYFATSMFLDKAPFGRGRVVLEGADTALSIMLYTTTGILTPGIMKKGTEIKVVFQDERTGQISDIFGVPASELTPKQVQKKGLLTSELNWAAVKEPDLGPATEEAKRVFEGALVELEALLKEMSASKRASKAIENWKRTIAVKTPAVEFGLIIDNGKIWLEKGRPRSSDFVMATEDIRVLLDGLNYKGAITDAIVKRKLWISKNIEFVTIFKLDRLARFLAREKKESAAKG